MHISFREILIVGFVIGILAVLAYLVKIAPFIVEPFKSFLFWGLIVLAAVVMIFAVGGWLGIAGMGVSFS